MPIKHAALKQLRKDRKRRQQNQAARSELRTLLKRLATLLHDKKLDEARSLMPAVAKEYDRAASRRIVHRNTAARAKSRFMRQINKRNTR